MNSTHTPEIVAAALVEWAQVVKEPPGPGVDRIRVYLQAAGFGHWADYAADGDAEWCGAFAGYCLQRAGVNPELLRQKTPPEAGGIGSTYRIDALCRLDERRRVKAFADLLPGDVVCVGRKGRCRWGEHIVLVERLDGANIKTIEGNASGRLGDGSQGEGVVRRARMAVPTDAVKGFFFGFRPLPGDYIGG